MKNENNGINVFGNLKLENGLGEGARMTVRSLLTTKYAVSTIDLNEDVFARQSDDSLDDLQSGVKYDISILNINADHLLDIRSLLDKKIWNTYRIGVWYWELTEFPYDWFDAFDYVDEIWAPTKFIKENLEKVSPIPVIYMPPGIEREEALEKYNRKYFNLPENRFLFFNYFDAMSYSTRKNPKATIEAFKKAFKQDDDTVGLVLKINNSKVVECLNEIEAELSGYKNIYIVDKILTRDEINGLINACDVSVSLHRSEGLGLLCEESMYFGKPVIATGWSGNMDFMTEQNSCLVDYTLEYIQKYHGNNDSNQKWAEANTDTAAKYMIRLKNDKEYYNEIASKAKEHIRMHFSSEVCGKHMSERIDKINKDKNIWLGNRFPDRFIDKDIDKFEGEKIPATYGEAIKRLKDYYDLKYYRNGKVSLKRKIKDVIRFIVDPVAFEQSMYNAAMLKVVSEHQLEINKLNAKIKKLERAELNRNKKR